MVFSNAIKQEVSDGDYGNDVWRQRHGYKETHTPDHPFRRNRDFKPVPYGSAKGPLNFRHSEPYCLLKNMKDLYQEDHNIGIRWFKQFFKGAAVGGLLGLLHFAGGNTGNFEMNKLMAATGHRAYSGQYFR